MLLVYLVVVSYLVIGFCEAGYNQRQQEPYSSPYKFDAIMSYLSDGLETFLITIFWLPILIWNLFKAGCKFLFRAIKALVKRLRKFFKH